MSSRHEPSARINDLYRHAAKVRENATRGLPMPFTAPGTCPCCSGTGTGEVCDDEGCTNYGGLLNAEY